MSELHLWAIWYGAVMALAVADLLWRSRRARRMTMRLIWTQRDRMRTTEMDALDRRVHSLAMLELAQREVERRLRKRAMRRRLLAPIAFLGAIFGIFTRGGR